MHQKEQIFTAKMLVSLFTILKVFPIPVSNVRLSSLCPYPTDIRSHHAIDMDKKKKKEILKVTYATFSWGKEV